MSDRGDWTELFGKLQKPDGSIVFRVIKKNGYEFLMLPESASLAIVALELYPAQTPFAKAARGALRIALKTRCPLPLPKVNIPINFDEPFLRFIGERSGIKSGTLPNLAILAGNPRAIGRRFILLLFGNDQQSIVKAALTAEGRRLIKAESSFLESVPTRITGLPKVRGDFVSDSVEAFATDYISGNSPMMEDRAAIEKLLTGWLDRSRKVGVNDVPAWQELQTRFASDPIFVRIGSKLANCSFHPTLFHGDFAPWNIKVKCAGEWIALDWERGNLVGFPGWDWFHYVVQSGILAQKQSAAEIFGKLEELIRCHEFRRYAEAAEIMGTEKILAVAYLFYCLNVLRPSEGVEVSRELMRMLVERWL